MDVDYRLLIFQIRRELTETPTGQRVVSHSADDELKDAGKYKSGQFTNKLGVVFLDSLEQYLQWLGIRRTVTTGCRVTVEEPCRFTREIELERLVLIISWIGGLVPHLDGQPNFSCSVAIDYPPDVGTTIRGDCPECIVQIGLGKRKR